MLDIKLLKQAFEDITKYINFSIIKEFVANLMLRQ